MEKKRRFFEFDSADNQADKSAAKLKVIGVGGGGCNAVDFMISKGLRGVEYIAVNTDQQVLEVSKAPKKISIGKNITRGLGAGADPEIGRKAIEENREELKELLTGSDMVFITAGMGGGTGTGASSIIAEEAKSLGALVVAVVTEPFSWEGKQRMRNAQEGISALRKHVDSLIVIPNNRLLNNMEKTTSAFEAFARPNEVLFEATQGIADIINIRGIINVDFADVRKVMISSGKALMGRGTAHGENRAIEAAQKAISSPLLESVSINGAKKVLVNFTGSSNLKMEEIEVGQKVITEAVGENADIIFGWVIKEDMEESVAITVIATGFEEKSNEIKSEKHIVKETQKPYKQPHKEDTLLENTIFGDLEKSSNFPKTAESLLDYQNSFSSVEEKENEEKAKNASENSFKNPTTFLKMLYD